MPDAVTDPADPRAPRPFAATGNHSPSGGRAPSGGRVGRIIARPLFWVVALVLLFGFPLARSFWRLVPPPPPVLGQVPAFAMTDQTGQPFGARDLAGKVWVADFIFTNCQTMCPLLTEKMTVIGKRARKLGPDVHLVSFTVDPERDTPARLAAYASQHGASAHKWTFLTGSLAAVQQAVVDGFKIGVDRHKTADDFWDIVHGEHLVLVDRRLRIRGYFDASDDGIDKLLAAMGRIANETDADVPPGAPPAGPAGAPSPASAPSTPRAPAPASPSP